MCRMGRNLSEGRNNQPYHRPSSTLKARQDVSKHAYKRFTVLNTEAQIESDDSSILISYDLSLGQGSYSKVYRGSSPNGQAIAVKVMDITRTNFLRYFQLEVDVLSRLAHSCLPRYQSSFITDREGFLAMEYVEGTDLEEYYQTNVPAEHNARHLFAQMVDVLEYLHCNLIAHRDIKLENILINSQTQKIKLIDFGLCLKVPNKDFLSTQFVGSPFYMAAESLNQMDHNPFIADIWSMGVVLFYMQAGKLPFSAGSLEELIDEVNSQSIEWDSRFFSKRLLCLLKSILCVDPKNRISLEDIKLHPWLTRMELEPAP